MKANTNSEEYPSKREVMPGAGMTVAAVNAESQNTSGEQVTDRWRELGDQAVRGEIDAAALARDVNDNMSGYDQAQLSPATRAHLESVGVRVPMPEMGPNGEPAAAQPATVIQSPADNTPASNS